MEKDKYRDLPLHTVAYYMGNGDGGLEAIQLLLKEYPQAAREKDRGENLPIHDICHNQRLEVDAFVLPALPGASKAHRIWRRHTQP